MDFNIEDVKQWLNLRTEEINMKLNELLKIADDLHLFAPSPAELIVTIWFNEHGYLNFSVRIFLPKTKEEITQNVLGDFPKEPEPNSIIMRNYRVSKDDDLFAYDQRKFLDLVKELDMLKNEINILLSEIYAFKIFRIVLNRRKTRIEGIAIETPDFGLLLTQNDWIMLPKFILEGKPKVLTMADLN